MTQAFALPEMTALWTDQGRYDAWTRVEILVTEAQALLGHVPMAAFDEIRRAPAPPAARVRELIAERDHETLSFLSAFCEPLTADSARWVHLGMTSYDLVDTALGHTLARATDLLLGQARRLRRNLADRAIEHWDTLCMGRTHGIHAEPTTFGHKLAGFAFAADRSIGRLLAARAAVAVGTISGAVGTYALIDPAVEQYVCGRLGLAVEQAPSQVVARDRHAELAAAVALLGACVEQLALELRLLQRTEIREVEERRGAAYQGSSAMPHKRNPTGSERLCGLARLLRGQVAPMLENVALWHERDLAHAAVERVALPEILGIGHYQAALAADLVDGIAVDGERMRAGLDLTRGTIYSSAVLADLLRQGTEREQAYRTVQAAADRAAANGIDFRTALADSGVEVAAETLRPDQFPIDHEIVLHRLQELDLTA
ncbi:adenylosuccinate lyase [Nocardia transvalensis]|uniref:Adenylosuccinate lyase n=1 Tax=Nocardia transvalensis TaxID=37333 RepID=A0A7W9PJY9_9NOCA|nr:adenylosuccinate lyase [Nocardia transvalensis]MBB5917427.1 adenylosuccinate lyase [Nocardia transvalensis]